MILLLVPWFSQAYGLFWGSEITHSPFVLSDSQSSPFDSDTNLNFKGQRRNFHPKNTIKLGTSPEVQITPCACTCHVAVEDGGVPKLVCK